MSISRVKRRAAARKAAKTRARNKAKRRASARRAARTRKTKRASAIKSKVKRSPI
jgi:hypothetical protein